MKENKKNNCVFQFCEKNNGKFHINIVIFEIMMYYIFGELI